MPPIGLAASNSSDEMPFRWTQSCRRVASTASIPDLGRSSALPYRWSLFASQLHLWFSSSPGWKQTCWRHWAIGHFYSAEYLRWSYDSPSRLTSVDSFSLSMSRWARNRVAGVHPILMPVLHALTACGEEARIASWALSPPPWMPPVARRNSHAGSLLRIHKITSR